MWPLFWRLHCSLQLTPNQKNTQTTKTNQPTKNQTKLKKTHKTPNKNTPPWQNQFGCLMVALLLFHCILVNCELHFRSSIASKFIQWLIYFYIVLSVRLVNQPPWGSDCPLLFTHQVHSDVSGTSFYIQSLQNNVASWNYFLICCSAFVPPF